MGKLLSGLVVLTMIWFATGGPDRLQKENQAVEEAIENARNAVMPAGAIEHFESTDGKMSLTLYLDRLSAKGFQTFGGGSDDFDMAISEIRSVKTFGTKFIIYDNDSNMLEFQIPMPGLAKSFENAINELRRGE